MTSFDVKISGNTWTKATDIFYRIYCTEYIKIHKHIIEKVFTRTKDRMSLIEKFHLDVKKSWWTKPVLQTYSKVGLIDKTCKNI